MIKTFILAILAAFGIYSSSNLFGGLIESESIIATISGEPLTLKQYQDLKTGLKTKMTNRNKIKLINIEVQKWIEIANLEIKKCVLTNVDMKNIIDAINQNCL